MRVLFFAGGKKFDAQPYESLFAELAARGHEVHLAYNEVPKKRRERSPQITVGLAPHRRRLDGWSSVASLTRRLADLARYAHPRYEQAAVLRARMTENTLLHLTRAYEFEPVGRLLALRLARRLASETDAAHSDRVVRRMARLEQAIPSSSRIERYLRERAPDVVLVTAVVKKPSQVEFLKSARRVGIPAGICVASWDNLTNKGLLKVVPERVFVWNDVQRREAIELHGMPADRVVATGAQPFDPWFERRPSTTREEFMSKLGIDPAAPYVLYLGSSSFITEGAGEVEFVKRWIDVLSVSRHERLRQLGIVVRPHPGAPRRWTAADLGRPKQVAVWPPEGMLPVSDEAKGDFFDEIAHSAAVVGINTTAMIEAAIIGKSVLTIRAPDFAQENTLHFHYLLAENGGFLHIASSLEEHADQLARVLDEDVAGAEQRRRFVESFIRPHGLDRPATPILADAVEELASVSVDALARGVPWGLRAVLTLEAGLSSLAIAVAPARRRLRKLRRRVVRRRMPVPREHQTVHP